MLNKSRLACLVVLGFNFPFQASDLPFMELLVDRNAMEESDSRRFRFFTRGDRNTLKLTINRGLRSGQYDYQIQGYRIEHLARQTVTVNGYGNQSELTIELPDQQDKAYQGRHDLFTGMPATVVIPVQ
ncbi:hypothetical protein [Vibrio variabilis]|uniref:hypothetical protein n=1 Tax=Vibrio variabilis TaxID=990271 RepID=UPI000DD6D606|nr:hypothetical protein [Vibrio variabilis]